MKGGITYASCKEIGGETSSQKSGACKESDSKEGSGEEGGEEGCFSGEKDRCQEIGSLVLAIVVDMNRRRLISPPIFLGGSKNRMRSPDRAGARPYERRAR